MTAGGVRQGWTRPATLSLGLFLALASAGCSSSPGSLGLNAEPSYLGAAPRAADMAVAESDGDDTLEPRVSPSKVLSAIVFERVTGREVDPARLIER